MRALIINMRSAAERMGFMAAQMDSLGLVWERIEAVTPATLDPPANDPGLAPLAAAAAGDGDGAVRLAYGGVGAGGGAWRALCRAGG